MQLGVELLADGLDRLQALFLEHLADLPQGERDALDQRIVAVLGLGGLERALEVVQDGQELRDQLLAGEADLPRRFLALALAEVVEIGEDPQVVVLRLLRVLAQLLQFALQGGRCPGP